MASDQEAHLPVPSRSRRISNHVVSGSGSFSYPAAGGFGSNPLEQAASQQSSHAQADEEELRWAALEKLPTYNRLRTSVFQRPTGSVRQVDVKDLSIADFRHLLQKVHRNQDAEDDQLIVKMRKRLDRVGIELPTIEVRYEDLSVQATCHVGNRGLPTLWNAFQNIIESLLGMVHLAPTKKKVLTILDNVSGVLKPGRMTLLLGPPSSGKTTLLLKLAGKLDSNLKVEGSVTFNGHTHNEFVPQKTACYVSQQDLHNAELTVRETLDFSARLQGVGPQYHLLEEVVKREKEAGIRPESDVDTFMKASALPNSNGSLAVEYVLAMLGLDICADTMVGDNMRRGISGGQKKRVTTGEMIVGPMKVLFMDEISTGLDSSTTFSIVKSLSRFAHAMSGTVMVSLLQPAPETFNLFDDILLLSEGQVVYHGPRGDVMAFFEWCGFQLPERKAIADFLQEVTSHKDQQQYWADRSRPYCFVPVAQLAQAFRRFSVGVQLHDDLAVPFPREKCHPAALVREKYSVPKLEVLKACFRRERLLMKRNAIIFIVQAIQVMVGAFISATSWFRTRLHQDTVSDGSLYMNSLFFAIVLFFFTGFGELASTVARLPVLIKQRDMLLCPAWAYSISSMILSVPHSLLEVGIYTCMTYFVTGFAPDPGRFFKFFLVLFMIQQQAGGLFRFVAGLCRTDTLAFTLGWIMILLVFMLGGFIIPRPDIPVWWRWAFWVTNMAYAEQAISVNEMLAPRWQKDNPGDNTTQLGVAVLESRGMFPYSYWYWIGIGGLIGSYILFNVGFTITLGYMPAIGKPQPILSEQELAEKEATRTGVALPKSASQSKSSQLLRSRSLSAVMSAAGGAPMQVMSRSKRLPSKRRISENGEAVAETEEMMVIQKGMILPFQPLSISFADVSYYVDMPVEMKSAEVTESKLQLLSGITGAFQPGVLTALVGVSGAGKTTLMDVLAGRKTGGYVEGDIRISGFPKNQKTFARIAGYCEQNDIHSPQTTVREALVYSAWLRLASEIDDTSKMAFVEEVLNLVELKQLENALVGLPGITGLSTEQRKRLTIAVELVANPSIIFLDEPTSGLDARAAAIVMRTVRNTVDTGRTVVCTIHQPSIDIFEAFDELLLLKRGGRVIYAGELGHQSQKLVEYFQAIPGIPQISDGYNPATWMLEVSNLDMEMQLGVDFGELYLKSPLYERNKQLVRELSEPVPGSKDLYFPTDYPQSFLKQLWIVLWKQNITYWRSPHYNLVRYGFSFFTAIICGSIFWRVGQKYETSRELTTTIGALYGACLFLCFNNAQTVQPMVSIERTVHYREKAAGLYSSLAYALAQVLIEIPYVLVQAAMYSSITYAMLDFEWTAAKFFWYFYIECTGLITFTYYGMMMVSITPNLILATVVSAFFYTIFNLFSGFLLPRPYIPGWYIWYYWFCPVAWSVYGLIASQYGDVARALTVTGAADTTVKQYLQDQFGFQHDFLPVVAPVCFLWPVFFAVVFMIAIKYLNFQRR